MNQKYAADWKLAESIDGMKDARQIRALYDGLYVEATADNGAYTIHSSSGRSYTVDLRHGDCDCPDAEQRDGLCKHAFAAMYWTGAAPVPVDALSADKIVVDAITDDNESLSNLDLLDHYKLVTLNGDDPSKSIRWAADGELVAVSSADGIEPASALDDDADAVPALADGAGDADAIDAERAMIDEQEPDHDGDLDVETPRCGSTDTQNGEPCQRAVADGYCHLHADDGQQDAADDAGTIDATDDTPATADGDDAATADALADTSMETIAVTDGGQATQDAIQQAIAAAGDDATVIVILPRN